MAKGKVWYIEVDYSSYCELTSEGTGEYSRDSTHTSHTIDGLHLVKEAGYKAAEVLFKPEKGKIYHLLYAVVSSGDSFGWDEGHRLEVIGVYKDRKVAEANKKLLEEGKKNRKGLVPLKVEGLKEKHQYHTPWGGMFDPLDYLEIESLILN